MHCCIEFIKRQSSIFGDICKLPAEKCSFTTSVTIHLLSVSLYQNSDYNSNHWKVLLIKLHDMTGFVQLNISQLKMY
jgi:hypothetical protein